MGVIDCKKKLFIVSILSIILSPPISSSVRAEEIRMAIGLSLPPYVIEDTLSGMEFDIVKESLLYKGHHIQPRFVLLQELSGAYKKGLVDGVMTITEDFGLNAFLADVVIVYRNYAITLSENNIRIDSIEDLKGKRIVAFQNAKTYLGKSFASAIEGGDYQETPKQSLQVNLLYLKRTDVIITDKNIFLYYRKLAKDVDIDQEITYHPIFKPNPYRVGFRDPRIRDDFNEGLQHLKQTGRYGEIVKSYVSE